MSLKSFLITQLMTFKFQICKKIKVVFSNFSPEQKNLKGKLNWCVKKMEYCG